MSKIDSDFQDDNEGSEVDDNFAGDYVGDVSEDGKRHGHGMSLLSNRDQYEGEYRDGLRNGTGCYQFVNGAKYHGEWKQGMKHGKGKFWYPDGSWYCGSFKNNKKNGFGKYLYGNKDVYEGEWKDDRKHGLGCYYYQETGIFTNATWNEGELKGPIEINYGNFLYHGYWNKHSPVGEGAFSFDMKYVLPGHIEMIPSGEAIDKRTSEVNEGREKSIIAEDNSVQCVPRFIAHEIERYNYSKLPQQPISLPKKDSTSTLCTQSSCSSSEDEIQSVRGPYPTLVEAKDSESVFEVNSASQEEAK